MINRLGRLGYRSTYDHLNRMLDDAIAGRFEERDYDESELSKLEVKWKRYLTSSGLSAKKLEAERTAIQSLVTDISHQTKTPLANILLYTQLLEEQPLEAPAREMVEEVRRQSEKLDFLIQSLVKTSRLETGTFRFDPRKQEAEGLIRRVTELAKAKAEAKGMEIKIEGAENPGDRSRDGDCGGNEDGGSRSQTTASFDEKWPAEALFNIVDNAVKYAPAGSQIEIRMIPYEMFLCIEVRDQGIGIEEEEIPKIFDRFYRGKNVRSEEGVGIGLYLSRQIIEGQGGYMKVISKPGKGSRFQVFLPRE